jgi:hypothetical protein
MAFPSIAGTPLVGTDAAATTSRTVPLDAAATAGQLIVIFIASNADAGTVTHTFDGGAGTKEFENNYSSSPGAISTFSMWTRPATGGETGITVGTGVSTRASWVPYRLDPGGTSPTWTVAVSGVATTFGTAPDPPSLTPPGGAADFMWFGLAFWDAQGFGQTATAAPASYLDLRTPTSGNTNVSAGIATAHRFLNAATENPGPFTLSSGADAEGMTAAIKVVATAGPGAVGIKRSRPMIRV